jgi:putative SOS response-associated peptidase YedK
MCSKFTMAARERKIRQAYPYKIKKVLTPNYNLSPTQEAYIITADEPDIIQPMHFGLVPYWSKEPKMSFSSLNARSHEVMKKKTTYAPLVIHHKTCLVLADGFIENDNKTGVPLPWYFTLTDREVFAFAGLWSRWKSKDGLEVYNSFTIMTVESNDIVGKVHSPTLRMPAILEKENEGLWLSKDLSPNELLTVCKSYPDELMKTHQVSRDINKSKINGVINNRPELILPI